MPGREEFRSQREGDPQSTSQQGSAAAGCAGQEGKVVLGKCMRSSGQVAMVLTAVKPRDRPGSAVRIISAAAISWGAGGWGRAPENHLQDLLPHVAWGCLASSLACTLGSWRSPHARSSTVEPPQTWLMPGIDGRVPRAEARLQQTEDGTGGSGLLAPGWPAQPSCLNVSLFLSYLFPLRSVLS